MFQATSSTAAAGIDSVSPDVKEQNPTREDEKEFEGIPDDCPDVEGTTLLKPAPLDSVVPSKPPNRRRSPSPEDPYPSSEDDNKIEGISEDFSDAEGTTLLEPSPPYVLPSDGRSPSPEDQYSTSKDFSDVEDFSDVDDLSDYEDPDVKDVEDSTNVEEDVEDSINVGEVEDSPDVEFSSDGTTLLKPVLYIDILREEDPEIKKAMESIERCYRPDSSDKAIAIDFLKLTGAEFSQSHIIAGPALQVIAVHICNPSSKELKIYGDISVTDDKYNTYYIYNRGSECPEKVSPGHEFLPLNRCSILPVMWGNVEFRLKDGGDLIFAKKHPVEYLSKYEDDYVRKLVIHGKDDCRAIMFFTIIPYARIVEFRMYLCEPRPYPAEKAFQVYGRIKANEALCFKKDSKEPVSMWHGAFNDIEQSTTVLAVSVFSPLLLDVELYSGRTKLAYQKCEVVFLNFKFHKLKYKCYNEDYELLVAVEWCSYGDYFRFNKWSTGLRPQINKPIDYPTVVYENEKGDYDLPVSMPIHKPIDYPIVVYGNEKSDCLPATMPVDLESVAVTSHDGSLVEVFSVVVSGGDSLAPLALCGTIVVRDGGGTFYIFSRNRDCPDKLSSSNKLQQSRRGVSLSWPWRCVVEKSLFMHFKLKDVDGNKVCTGSLSLNDGPLPCVPPRPFDTRICAVIPGENGYFAAVHFSVFKNGLQAKVTVECSSSSSKDGPNYNNGDGICVYGSAFSEYSNYNYPSNYDKEYYRSIIFKRSKQDAVKVKNGSKIPLSKSMVSAPPDCEGLIVDVDLWVKKTGEEQLFGHAFGRILFKVNKKGVCEMRDGDGGEGWGCADCHIKVMVDWVHV